MQQLPSSLLATPPLGNGDRLDRHEFERRYDKMPHLKKAELIEGVVFLSTALRFKRHGQPHGFIMGWLGTYQAFTMGVEVGNNSTVRLDLKNEPQPDAVLRIREESGGQSVLSDDDYIEGAPELIVEVAASSVAIDLHDKKRAYLRNGVKEYLVWRVLDQQFDWFYLQDCKYVLLTAEADRIIRSRSFPGLWLAVDDLLAGKMQQVLAVLQQGLATAEHNEFVQPLAIEPEKI
ncbi:Uma2 family endonuclease [Microcoleus sp. FACHB-1515]|nr:Uma2 family endonuclease [Microcoleus sp. FACHB-1515]MBD2091016.1 Uma2 family endonuclease [Microcoleus sp. FACHB-1515]